MTGLSQTNLPSDKPQIITSRLLNAPQKLVWLALTDPEHIKHFWGPDGFSNTIRKMDVKPNGHWLFTMHGPDGTNYPNRIIYRAVNPPTYLSWDHDGGEDDPDGHRFFGELELFEEGKKTCVELRMTEASMAARDAVAPYAVPGGIQNMERLAAYIAPMVDARHQFVSERIYNASPARLFTAVTDVEELKHWFVPNGMKMIKAKMDFKPGGRFHYGMVDDAGNDVWGLATYRLIKPNEQILYVQSFSDAEGRLARHPMSSRWPREIVTKFEFIAEGGAQTKLRLTWTYSGIDDDEAVTFCEAHSDMAHGWTSAFDRLQAYLR